MSHFFFKNTVLKFVIFFLICLNSSANLKYNSSIKNIIISKNNIKIIDGDTIQIGIKKLRLHGIDTPELKQKCQKSTGLQYFCGIKAKHKLSDIIANNSLKCLVSGKDRYKRLIATCYVNKININELLVKEGWALAYRKYSDRYINSEEYAKSNKSGLWEGSFIVPWKWRLIK